MPGAYLLRQGEISFRLVHFVEIEAQRRKAIIARKQQLRLACFQSHRQRFVVVTTGQLRLAVALMNLSKHDQRHGEMIALIQRPIDRDRPFGGGNALLRATIGESAIGDGEISEDSRLKSEIDSAQ